VSEAIDEVIGGGDDETRLPPAASFLFLPGIASIHVRDHVRGLRSELDKRDTLAQEILVRGIVLRRQRTMQRQFELLKPDTSPTNKSQDWWVVERVIGSDDCGDDERAACERHSIRDAIQNLHLPAENWSGVEQIPLAVALPDPARTESDEPRPIGTHGRFCIGLPTQVATGLPLWATAHFHGKIDRTAIDFENDYNALLFDAIVELATVLIERVKCDPSIATRRLATLAMERGKGELANAVYQQDGLARTAIVLDTDGDFMKGSDLRLPKIAEGTLATSAAPA
jgi:hypothetical protein